MSVRAKLRVNFVQSDNNGAAQTIFMSPVYTGSDENKAFFAATPGGQIILSVVNKAAADQLVQGKEFYVDFTEAPAA